MDIQTRKPPVCSICFRFPYCLPHAKHVRYHWQLDAVHDYHLVTGPNGAMQAARSMSGSSWSEFMEKGRFNQYICTDS